MSTDRQSFQVDSSVWGGLVPKVETQAADFVAENPSWDGRGIIVGILDTGVDPGAAGLSLTTDGLPKVIDLVDCSGSGDVVMGPAVSADETGCLQGLSGRKLTVDPAWNNPSGKYRIGVKLAYDLYPKPLKNRIKEARKKEFAKETRRLEADLQREIASSTGNAQDDAKAKLAQLRAMEKDVEDPGPVLDCVVFHDGSEWQAVVDVTETGDLSRVTPMTNYRTLRQYSRFSAVDGFNFAVNIFDSGSLLSIVTDCSPHGTHVAGITAAYYPDQPECNGVAPGAQIVSLRIGDSRLGSMETGVALHRALIEAVRRGCHIINMSYGEATAVDNYGSFVRLADEMVKKHGIIFVSSAGNNGPALSTVGCPGGTSNSVIGVGAFVTTSLMTAAYSMHTPQTPSNYTWSSVGPTLDGDIGVSIIAPGGAVTSVSNWTLNKKQLMNGTSMSSPNACGCITLLLSAARQNGLSVSPASVRRAVENSALPIAGVHPLGQGSGLIQVSSAWSLLSASREDQFRDIPFKVHVNSERFSRGIYLRQPHETSMANSFSVSIEPDILEEDSVELKTNFEMRLQLHSSVDWITCPSHVLVVREGKQFGVRVDPRGLAPGVHVGFVSAYDESFASAEVPRGPVVRVPVTVVKPELLREGTVTLDLGSLTAIAGERIRRFIVPPKGCTFIDARITDNRSPSLATALTRVTSQEQVLDVASSGLSPDEEGGVVVEDSASSSSPTGDDAARTLVLHALQLFRGTPYRNHEHDKHLSLQPGSESVTSWAVSEGVTMELVLAPLWSTVGEADFSVTLHFRGVTPHPSQVIITGGQRVSDCIRVEAELCSADLAPVGKLDKWVSVLKPAAPGMVLPLGERDILPDGTNLYQLVLEYEFDQAEAGDVTPRWPGLQGVLYESDFHSQLGMLFDSRRRLVGTVDAFPDAVKIGKGKFTIRYQVRHSSASLLEGMTDLPVHLERSLKSAVSLSFFKSKTEAMVGTDKQGTRAVIVGGSVGMFIREPSLDQLPKAASPGDFLTGSITYLKKSNSVLGSGTKPGGYPVKYLIADTKPPVTKAAVSSSETKEDGGIEAVVREAKIKFLKSFIGNSSSFGPLFESLNLEYPGNLSIRQAALTHAVKVKDAALARARKGRRADRELRNDVDAVLAAADSVLALINTAEVATELGMNVDKENTVACTRRKEMESKKGILIESLGAKATATLDMLRLGPGVPSDHSDSAGLEMADAPAPVVDWKAAFEDSVSELARWDDVNADKYWSLQIARLQQKERTGQSLKKLNDLISSVLDGKAKEAGPKELIFEERDSVLSRLGWRHIQAYTSTWTALAGKDCFDAF